MSTFLIILFHFIIFGYYLAYNINTILLHISGLQAIPINPNSNSIMYHHWFITLILCCYIIFPIFYYLIKKNYKLITFIIIFLYISYILFYNLFYDLSADITLILFQKILILPFYKRFLPRYFDFIFGMLLGFWISKSNMKNLYVLQKNNKIALFLLGSLIALFILSYYFYSFSLFDLLKILCFPLITVSFVIFNIYFLSNKPRINKVLRIPGKESYEIFLLHNIPVTIIDILIIQNKLLDNNIIIWIISISIIIFSSILLAYPFNYFGVWIKKEKKTHKAIIMICQSLIIYATFAYIIFLFNLPILNNVLSIILYILILTTLSIIVFIKNLIKKNMKKKAVS